MRWWGDVKVEAAPQQVNSQLGQLEQLFAAAFGNLKVNQLAQSVAFVTGPEFVLTRDRRQPLSVYAVRRSRSRRAE